MKKIRFLLCILPLLLIFVQPVFGWDTDIKSKYKGWKSIYNSVEIGNNPVALRQSEDEHAKLSDLALKELGVKHIYGIGTKGIEIVDLNASIFRSDTVGAQGTYPDHQRNNTLETRLLPPPPHFSGIPDFSYSIADWINKNQLCPVNDGNIKSAQLCHTFMGWMGALNSNHFGTQAANSYWHLHKLAISLANRAKEMREKFSKDDVALKQYESFIREAEREALSVEGYAQHFLEDRWAIGHMWERWNSSEFSQLPSKDPLTNMEIGAFAGFLHGSESTVKIPDALSSPNVSWGEWGRSKTIDAKGYVIPGDGFNVPEWGREKSKKTFPGIGDYRLEDMIDGGFGKEYKQSIGTQTMGGKIVKGIVESVVGVTVGAATGIISGPRAGIIEGTKAGLAAGDKIRTYDYRLEVDMQKKNMLECFQAGWSEVIRGFGKNPAGGFGSEHVEIKPLSVGGYIGFDSLGGVKCDDMWATNEAIDLGWNGSLVTGTAQIARSFLALEDADQLTIAYPVGILAKWAIGTDPKSAHKVININREAWVGVSFNIWEKAKLDKKGTSLARGAIGSAGIFKTGDKYEGLAKYVEPIDLDELPLQNLESGLDMRAWYGFFNKSHSDYWCEYDQNFDEIRGSLNPVDLQACVYMADRQYEGTDPEYKGERKEVRRTGGMKHGQQFGAVCSLLGEKPTSYSEGTAEFLHPGYVGKPYAKNKQKKMQSIENWCRQIPVINYIPDDSGEIQDDWVAKFEEMEKEITITGYNFGDERGTLSSCLLDNEALEIRSWGDESISFMPPVKGMEHAHDGEVFNLCIKREDNVKSVGSFILIYHVKPVKIEQIQVKNDEGVYFDKQAGISKVIPYGKILYVITFAEKMDVGNPNTEIRIGDKLIKGYWFTPEGNSSDTVWHGWYDSPEVIDDENRFTLGLGKHFEGEQVLHIDARSARGGGVDPGDDPIPFKPKGDATDEIFKASYKSPNEEYSLSFGKKEAPEIAGKVTSSDGKIVSGAKVSVEIAGKKYDATSAQDGSYQITIPKEVLVPKVLIIKAGKDDTYEGSEIVKATSFLKANIVISILKDVIVPYAKSGCWSAFGGEFLSLSSTMKNGKVLGKWFIPENRFNDYQEEKTHIDIEALVSDDNLTVSGIKLTNRLASLAPMGESYYGYSLNNMNLNFIERKVQEATTEYITKDLEGEMLSQRYEFEYVEEPHEWDYEKDCKQEFFFNGNNEKPTSYYRCPQVIISYVKSGAVIADGPPTKYPMRFSQVFSPVKSIEFTSSDFSTAVKEVNPGEKIWLKASGKSYCDDVKDQMLVRLMVPRKTQLKGEMAWRDKVVILTESAENSGEFHSPDEGISIDEDPGRSKTHIEAYAIKTGEPGTMLIKIPESRNIGKIRFNRHDQKREKKIIPNGPFNPNIGYRAVMKMKSEYGEIELIYYHDPEGKQRTEYPGFANQKSAFVHTANISRFDLGVHWTILGNANKYIEGILQNSMYAYASTQIVSKEEVSKGRINGIPATKFKIQAVSSLSQSNGIFWISDEGIIVKYDAILIDKKGKKSHHSMEMKKLDVGKQDPSLFEVPKGYKAGMGY